MKLVAGRMPADRHRMTCWPPSRSNRTTACTSVRSSMRRCMRPHSCRHWAAAPTCCLRADGCPARRGNRCGRNGVSLRGRHPNTTSSPRRHLPCHQHGSPARFRLPRSASSRDVQPPPIRRRRRRSSPRLCLKSGHCCCGGSGSIHPQAVGWWVLAVLAAWPAWPSSARRSVGRASSRARSTPLWWPWACPAASSSCSARCGIWWWRSSARPAPSSSPSSCPLTPVGEARLAEPSTGLAFDPLVLLLGALATVVVVLLLGVWPAVRASRVRIGGERASEGHPSVIVSKLVATGAPPSAVIGVRHALERGRGAASVPVGTALFGSALAVMALCATVVFADSLTHLTATPALYGSNYQLSFSTSNGGPGNPTSWVSSLEHDHSITGDHAGGHR